MSNDSCVECFMHPLPAGAQGIFAEHYYVIGFVNPEVLVDWYFDGKLNCIYHYGIDYERPQTEEFFQQCT